MNNGLIDKIESYFEFYKEQFGETVYLTGDELKIPIEIFKNMDKPVVLPESQTVSTPTQITFKKTAKTVDLSWFKSTNLEQLNNCINTCQECELGKQRNKFVFGTGNPNANIMIIGEAPGADEDEQGEPFVGRAGQLLTKMLEAIGINREDVFIANILKCRPPNNRRPSTSEIAECEPYLQKQMEIIKPAFILVLGLTAVSSLLKMDFKMGEIRGTVMDYRGSKLLITYHPSALLRNPNWKKPAWEDLKLLRKLYDEYLAEKMNK